MTARLRLSFLYIAVTFALHSIASAQSPSIPADERTELKIGVATFNAQNLSPLQESLATSIPLRLKEALSSVRTRVLTTEELAAYRRWSRERALLAEGKKAEDAVNGLGALAFSASANPQSRASSLKNAAEAKMRIQSITALHDEDIRASSERDIVWQGQGGQELFAPIDGDPLLAASRSDLDLLLYGRLIGFEEYLAVDIELYGRFLRKPVFTWKTAFAQDDSPAVLNEVVEALTMALAGRPVGSLRLLIEPEFADFWLDGEYAGRGSSLLSGIAVGDHVLELRSEGYESIRMPFKIAGSSTAEVALSLERSVQGSVAVKGTSDGTAVYLDATRAGVTPLEIPAKGSTHVLSARSGKAVDSLAVELAPGKSVFLDPRVKGEEESFSKRRDAFYKTFGWFMLSLPIAVLCNGMYDIQYRASSGSPSFGWETLRWTGIGASSFLLGVSVWKFVDYLGSTERR